MVLHDKLVELIEQEGYSVDDFETFIAEECMGFGVRIGVPSICMNEDCNYTTDMEPDQRRGWCEECGTNSMKSALILAGMI